jgi:hypothetical protein
MHQIVLCHTYWFRWHRSKCSSSGRHSTDRREQGAVRVCMWFTHGYNTVCIMAWEQSWIQIEIFICFLGELGEGQTKTLCCPASHVKKQTPLSPFSGKRICQLLVTGRNCA